MEKDKTKLLAKAKKVKVIVTDVDGVLTDGYLFIDDNENEPFGKFSILDGMGITAVCPSSPMPRIAKSIQLIF